MLGEGYINNSKTDETPLEIALTQAKISRQRYDQYQKLLKKAGCKSVGYGVLATDPAKVNREQMWYLVWAITNGPQTHMKTLIFSHLTQSHQKAIRSFLILPMEHPLRMRA